MYALDDEEAISREKHELENQAFLGQREISDLDQQESRLEVEIKREKVLIARQLKELEEKEKTLEEIEAEKLKQQANLKVNDKKKRSLRARH